MPQSLQAYQDLLAQSAPPAGVQAPAVPAAPPPQVGGLEGYLNRLTDPTGNPRFLLDLGARLMQPQAVGQSTLGHIAAAGSEAVSGRASRVAAAEETKRKREIEDLQKAAAERKLESADLLDQLTESQIVKNLRPPKGSGTVAAKVQERRAKAETLLKNYPQIYSGIDEALGAIDRMEFEQEVEADRAAAISDYYTKRAIVRTPEEQKADIAEINARFDKRSARYMIDLIKNKDVTEGFAKGATGAAQQGAQAAGGATPAPIATPQTKEEWQALGPDKMLETLQQTRQDATPEQLVQAVQRLFPDWTPSVEPVADAAEPEEKPKPKTRRARRQATQQAIRKRKKEVKTKKEQKAEDEAFAREEYKDMIISEDRPKLQVWLEQNRSYLTPEQRRKIMARITKLKGK